MKLLSMRLAFAGFVAIAALQAPLAFGQEVISILPVVDIGTTTTEPYQYSTTWTDETGRTIEHVTISNPDGTTVEMHSIDGTLVGTLYTDADGGWTFVDGAGQLVYADYWDEKAGDYVIAFGNYATWMDFDAQLLQPLAFYGGPSVIYGDVISIGIVDGVALLSASVAGGTGVQSPIYTVSGMAKGLLTALSKLGAKAVSAKASLLRLLSFEPKASKATPVKGANRRSTPLTTSKRRGPRTPTRQ